MGEKNMRKGVGETKGQKMRYTEGGIDPLGDSLLGGFDALGGFQVVARHSGNTLRG